ncbi:3'-5' RNA helicase YTHDC2 isoform X2 [Scleropages formosus]|uniref:3'-5' RNA helicase YTHDC2 isoform X2 n=1 Tax=Scleropages formosus TaxID=113540 RepID=UPI00087832D6|nr:3'-5' RNA helicase YTHDC2 isoform X2 [Scleropages formosus]
MSRPVAAQLDPSGSSRTSAVEEMGIEEQVKIAVNVCLQRLQLSEQKEVVFPSSLTSTERIFIHRLAQSLGYVSKSEGKGSNRYLKIRKKEGPETTHSMMKISLCHNSKNVICSFLQRFPVTNKEHTELLLCTERCPSVPMEADSGRDRNRTSGRLNNGIPQIPLQRVLTEFDSFRSSLPVYEHQEEIVSTVKESRVVLIVGETGSGKTTQIPQFLLDDCHKRGIPVRMFCTQPRQLAAIAVAERVAAERGESVGQTIGYQIRLESRVSPKTLVTFCTCGVLLRTLMAGEMTLSTVTHVIVDEIHERDALSDLLLEKLRDTLQNVPTLKLILSSAALDDDLFVRYFGLCPVIQIKGRSFEVKELFLEDILRTTGYRNKDMMKYKKEIQKVMKQQLSLTEWCAHQEGSSRQERQEPSVAACVLQKNNLPDDGQNEKDVASLEPWLVEEMDSCISDIFLNKNVDAFAQLFNLITRENVSVDYKHSRTSATPLMVAAGRGFLTQIEQLLSLGANISMKASNGWTALHWAKHFNQSEVVDLLESYMSILETGKLDESHLVQTASTDFCIEDTELLKAYHHSADDEKVDLDLIMHLLYNICQTSEDGAVLIFLPGYDEIVVLRDCILYDDKRFDCSQRFQIFTLHPNMQSSDQKEVLKCPLPGIRKIILSTSVAETSITVSDVAFVIDSGMVREKSFDALNNVTMLRTVWISKTSALQRKGRAGRCRPGICFHLFSRLRFHNMLEYPVPQLLRIPLQELCLYTKLLAPINCTIPEFLSKAPEAPPTLTVKHAVQMLKAIDAMDQWEDLTELGYHLADLPIEPRLGKMVLCAVVLKCLDPILTIACTLAHGEPFVLPTQASHRRAAMLCRKRFTAASFSDHMALLRAFQAWQKACSDGWERVFCEKNFLSQATLETIIGMRTQLLGQLRAIGFVRARGGGDIRDVNLNSENWSVVKAALVAGMYPNVILVDRESHCLRAFKEKKVHFHPTSVLSQTQFKKISPVSGQVAAIQSLPTDWLIYDEMRRAQTSASVRGCTAVTPLTVVLFGGCAKMPNGALEEPAVHKDSAVSDSSDSDMEEHSTAHLAQIKIDEWLSFKLPQQTATLVYQLRQKWYSLLLRRIRAPSKPWTPVDEATLQALVSVLTTEERAAGLQQPSGIGQRPRPVSSEEASRLSPWKTASRFPSSVEAAFADEPTEPERVLRMSSSPVLLQVKGHKDKSVSLATHLGDDQSDHCSLVSTERNGSGSSLSLPPGAKFFMSRPSNTGRYFIMKSSNMRNIEISQQKGIWSTTPNNELKLSCAFLESSVVVLIFSVQGSRNFQGYGRMSSDIGPERCQEWGSTLLGGVFKVEWIRKENLPFHFSQHLLNPWNENKKVQISRDGQELEPQVGVQLIQLWQHIPEKAQQRK